MMKTLRILIVEDEMTIALLIEDMLIDMGHQVVAMAMRLPPALEHAETAEIDFAILDINLDGVASFPVADVLTRRGVPFAFASGYGSTGLNAAYRQYPVVRKPFQAQDLEQAILQAA
jgi:CheY-like chemotaxis protein